ncbi:hypothetical protein ACO0LD_20625 [Undibacterium sp. Ji83W]|uniref:hypothetical protein n=1 Tax=Undibacterium sp. Ji83W TaxID=3413043 RepID=UPI003BF0F26C
MITHLARSLLVFFLIQQACPVFAEIVPESAGHGLVSFGGYQTKQTKSLADLPQPVVARLTGHLKNRLGETQYAHLKFVDAQLLEADFKNEHVKVPAYILQFDFELPGTPKVIFPAEIWLRSDASVLREINLPAYASSPDKQVFHAFKEFIPLIAKRGFLEKNMAYIIEHDEDSGLLKKGMFERNMTVRLEYNEKFDALIWTFIKTLSDDGYTAEMKSIVVNAHSGQIIRTKKSHTFR